MPRPNEIILEQGYDCRPGRCRILVCNYQAVEASPDWLAEQIARISGEALPAKMPSGKLRLCAGDGCSTGLGGKPPMVKYCDPCLVQRAREAKERRELRDQKRYAERKR